MSFRRRNWNLNDYPIGITEQDINPNPPSPRFIHHRYRAYIINSAICGTGDTPEQARANLEQNFEVLKQNRLLEGNTLSRPGKSLPIELASDEKISMNEALREDFIRRVLELDWAWISDESSLWDFHAEQTNDLLYTKILEVYGVDVSDIESGILWQIFQRINERKAFGGSYPRVDLQ